MTNSMLASVTALLLAVSQAGSAATISSGRDLDQVCSEVDRFSECVNYLQTVYRTAKAISRMTEPKLNKLNGLVGTCGPDQGIDTVPLPVALRIAWQERASKYPAQLGEPAEEQALLAFEERWPCKD